ncbi:hypothetical protein N9A28_09015 [Sulfurimonas sp.]|nr:hypothetical protein [Sulfurimonas sp.]
MPKIYQCHSTRSNITKLQVLDNTLVAYSTSVHGITILDFEEREPKKSIVNRSLNSDVTAVAFSPNSKLFAFINGTTLNILDIQTKKTVQTINTHDELIDILAFDSSSTYIIAGSQNGRVLQYKYNKPEILSRLCSFPHNRDSIYSKFKENENYVSSLAFHNTLMACSGYGGAIFIIDLHSQADKHIINHKRSRIDALCFIDENTLISGNNDGSIDITPLNDTKSYKTIQTPLSKIKQILILPNPDYILVVGVTNILTIIDIKKFKIVHSKYVEFEARINCVDIFNDETIVVALENKKISYIELPSVDKLKSLILHNSIEKAYKLINEEPMLNGTLEHKILEDKFDMKYKEATKALIHQNKTLATQILDIYKDVSSKQVMIRNLFIAFKNFRRFHGLFLEKKYALAYAMCSKYEPLKQTIQYKQMESVFKMAFANAQRQVMQGNIQGAKNLLFEYSTIIAKKPIIKMILNQNQEFIDFLNAVKKKDYLAIDKLVNSNELFLQIPNYTSLMDEIDTKLENIEFSIKSGEIIIAKKLLFSLSNVEHIKDKLQLLNLECKHYLELQKAYKNDHFKSCYTILDKHKSLGQTELGILLEKHWKKLMHTCEEFALKGNIKDIKKTLGDLLHVESRRSKLGDLIRVSFHVRINMLLDSKNYVACETIIYSYLDIFGKDSEIKQIMKNFEKVSSIKLALSQDSDKRVSRDNWTHSPIIMK